MTSLPSRGWGKIQMNKLVQRIFVAVALLSCVALAAAQGGGGGGQGRQGRGQRGGFRGGNSELGLAMRADVQKELSVTDDQKTKLTDLQAKSRQGFGGGGAGGGGAAGGTRPDPAAMQKMMAERRAQQKKDLAAILNDGQMKRLGELLLQRESYNALTQEEVQKALNFTSDQTQKVKDLQTKAQEANQSIMEKTRNQEMTREEGQAARTKNTKTMNDELQKILTADQAAKFKEMQGKAFTFETTNGGGGQRRGGGGGF